MTKGTILYVGGFELPDKNAAAHRVLANAKCLRDIGYDVILVGVSKEKVVEKNSFDVQGFKCYNIKYPESNKEWLSYLTSIREYKSIIKEEKPNIIIAYDFPAFPLYLLMKLPRIKIFADCTEWYEVKGNLLFRILKWVDTSLRMRCLQSKLDGLIVISDYLEKYYLEKGVKNIINIPPLVDLNDNKWAYDSSFEKENDEKLIFIYSGSPGSGNKDRLDIIIETLKEFYVNEKAPILLNIVGITEEYYVNNFNNNISLSSEYDFVCFKGRVSHLLSVGMLKNADFSIFLRENNLTNSAGFPTKFVESISAGTPVITNLTSNINKYLSDEDNNLGVIIKNLDPVTITETFKTIISKSRSEINAYKKHCLNLKLFDYRNYKIEFTELLEYY